MATLSVKHKFTSGKGDGPDSTRVRPGNWNAEHDLVVDEDGVILGRAPGSGPGPIEALPTSAVFPSGVVVDYAGGTAPSGWLFAFGQLLSRTTEATLFAAIGTVYGAGDGATTFRAPDLRGVVTAGKTDMGGADKGNLAGGGVLGNLLGGQYQNVGLSINGGILNDGANRTAGSLTFTGHGGTGGPDQHISRGDQGGHTNVAGPDHGHAVTVTGSTSGQLLVFANVQVNGSTGNFSIVQGTMVMNKIIKR